MIFHIPQPNFFPSSFVKLSDYEVDLATVFVKSELCLVAERSALENAHLSQWLEACMELETAGQAVLCLFEAVSSSAGQGVSTS